MNKKEQLQISECLQSVAVVLEKASDGAFRFEAVVARANAINGNGRVYPYALLSEAVDAIKENLDRHPGAVDHPDWGAPSTSDLGIFWETLRFEGNDLIGQGRIIPTRRGLDLQAVMEAKVAVGFSTRGNGYGEIGEYGDKAAYIMQGYSLDTIDAVTRPSVDDARIKSFKKEDLEDMNEELEKAIAARGVAEDKLTTATALVESQKVTISERDTTITGLQANLTEAQAKITELEAAAQERAAVDAATALENKIGALTADHRFGASIRKSLADLQAAGVVITVDTAEAFVTNYATIFEGAAAAPNEAGTPAGSVDNKEVETPAPVVEADTSNPDERDLIMQRAMARAAGNSK